MPGSTNPRLGISCSCLSARTGTGGYWCDVKITPELCQSWGLEARALPNLHQVDRDSLDVEPGYGTGYDSRD